MDEEDLISYAFLPNSELVNLADEKEALKRELLQMQEQMNDLIQNKSEKNIDDLSSKPQEASESSCSDDLIKPTVENGEDLVIENTSDKKEENNAIEKQKKSDGPAKIVNPKNINRIALAKQLRDKLNDLDSDLPKNIDGLIQGAVSSSKKVLENEVTFYKILLDNNLQSLVTNENKFRAYIKPYFFKI